MKKWGVTPARETLTDLEEVLQNLDDAGETIFSIMQTWEDYGIRGHSHTRVVWTVVHYKELWRARQNEDAASV